jgi:hypothetical protein
LNSTSRSSRIAPRKDRTSRRARRQYCRRRAARSQTIAARRRRAQRQPPFEVARHHAQRRRHLPRSPIRSMSSGRNVGGASAIASAGQRERPAHREQRAPQRGREAGDHDPRQHVTGQGEHELRKVKELAIEGGEPTAEPDAERDPGDAAGEHRRDRQLREVRRDREPAVAERSQHADLRALERDQAQQHVVNQERRDRQKDRRHHRPGDAVLVQLVADELVRQLMLAQ